MDITVQKSEEQAAIIRLISVYILLIDIDYCRHTGKTMLDQASRQESMAVLNPNHPQVKNDILRAQAKALLHLCDYVSALKEVDRLKARLDVENKTRDEISKMFT